MKHKNSPHPHKSGPTAARLNVPRERLLYGLHPVAAAWQNPARRCHRLLVTTAGLESLDSAQKAAAHKGLARPSPTLTEKHELDRLLPGAIHQGIVLEADPLPELGIEDICQRTETQKNLLVVVLDQVTDPHNIGAVMRSACAFGAVAVIMTERHAPESTATLAKSASGALEHVPLIRVTNLARTLGLLQKANFWCIGLAETGQKKLSDIDLSGNTALVLGAEGSGLRRLTMDSCDEIACLPTSGPVESLNVSNAAAVALYEVARRR